MYTVPIAPSWQVTIARLESKRAIGAIEKKKTIKHPCKFHP